MSTGFKRYSLRKREARALLRELAGLGLKVPEGAKHKVEVAEHGQVKLFLVDGRPLAAEKAGRKFPLLTEPGILEDLPAVVVDMGAVPHICNGADVMAPGIVELRGDFEAGSLVKVLDERHGKAIAVGEALVSSSEARGMERGKVVRNLHYVGDKIWRLARSLAAA